MNEKIISIEKAIAVLTGYSKLVAEVNLDSKLAFKVAIEALEKQIPKKPDLDGGVYCPCCLHEFKSHYDETRYCPNCGQAIDWSDTE